MCSCGIDEEREAAAANWPLNMLGRANPLLEEGTEEANGTALLPERKEVGSEGAEAGGKTPLPPVAALRRGRPEVTELTTGTGAPPAVVVVVTVAALLAAVEAAPPEV